MTTISKERIAEIKAFKETFTDPECPPSTPEQLARARPSTRFRGRDLSYKEILDDDEPAEPFTEVSAADAVMV